MLVRSRIKASESSFKRTVHLSDAKRAELLTRLEEMARRAALFNVESQPDEEIRVLNFRVTIHHPGGGSAKFLIFTHLFGDSGMWFLHSGFLNPGTRCVFIVPRGDDQEGGVLGVVERCELIERNIHAVAVRFESEVDPELFAPPPKVEPLAAGGSSVALPVLDARILMLDDQAADRELLAFHLRSTGLKITWRRRLDEALELMESEPPDLIITELNLPDGPGEQAIRLLRGTGEGAPVLVLTAESTPARLAEANDAGAVSVMQKPYDPAELLSTIHRVLTSHREQGKSDPKRQDTGGVIPSTLADDPDMAALIAAYLEQTRRLLSEIAESVRNDDLEGVRRLCLAIKGSGSGYGFAIFSEMAARAVRKLDSTASIAESLAELHQLHDIGRRLRAPDGAPGAASAAA